MSTFNFTDYLHQRLNSNVDSSIPATQFSVKTLPGGHTNHTARTTFVQPLSAIAGVNPSTSLTNLNLTGVVLKHAPPYMAVDPTRPMSVDRQLVEKKAFEILAGDDPDFPEVQKLLRGSNNAPTAPVMQNKVHVPKLIWHDEEQHMLWIEDLGGLKTLSEVLLRSDNEVEGDNQLLTIASDLGAFLSELYTATADPPASFISYMTKISDRTGIYDYLADVILTYLRTAPGMDDAVLLSERVRHFFDDSSDVAGPPKCLGMVDFWPENVLVNLTAGVDGGIRCGLVDWEYFGVSDASSELGMFLAHLHVHMLNTSTSEIAKKRIKDFTQAWLRAYVGAEGANSKEGTTWKPSNGFIRRLLLAHGRDLVRGVKLYNEKLDDVSKRRLLEGGARSLRAAGDSSSEIDIKLLKPSEDSNGEETHLREIWEGLFILVSI